MKLPQYISALLDTLESAGFEAFVVGGCVRDSLLGIPPEDWDICTSAKPHVIQDVFSDNMVIPTGLQHGTVTVVTPQGNAEITTFRSDGIYTNHRHPDSVSFVDNIYVDLGRRDFTVNAMAYAPRIGFVDPYHGTKDLEHRVLRCVGNPEERFREDALRILRALRFAAVYDFTINSSTAIAMLNNKDALTNIARERIYHELRKTLLAKCPGKVLKDYPELLSVIFKIPYFQKVAEKDPDAWARAINFLDTLPPEPQIRIPGLLAGCMEEPQTYLSCVHSLKMDNPSKAMARFLLTVDSVPPPSTLRETRDQIKNWGKEFFKAFLTWKQGQAVCFGSANPQSAYHFFKEIQEKQLCCSLKELLIDGNDLMCRGVSSGKQIGSLLELALSAVIDGKVPNEKKALLDHLFL